jgi:hypothetical protein
MIGNPLLLADDGYQISRSVRLRSSATASFSRTPAGAGNRKTWTWSGWVKRGLLGTNQNLLTVGPTGSDITLLAFTSSDQLDTLNNIGGATVGRLQSTAVFRDPSAYYHVVCAWDTTNATANNRIRLWVNGSELTSFAIRTNPTLSQDTQVNVAQSHLLGISLTNVNPFDGYLTEINFIDGQALTPSSFGETDPVTGVWKPKKYTGTYGTNGFYLNFSDPSAATAAAIGKDYSGNGNNWTPNNISVTAGTTYDSMLDVPTQFSDRGNYAVINPLDGPTNGSFAITDGNLKTESTSTANRNHARATIGVTSGKWYFEVVALSGDRNAVGVVTAAANKNEFVGFDTSGWGIYQLDGYKYTNNTGTAYGSGWTTAGDILMVAFDADNGKLFFGKNGTWFSSGDPAAGTNAAFTGLTSGPYFPAIGDASSGGVYAAATNFGQRPFAYTPPSGFKALHTGNLPEPTILQGRRWFDATLWTGNGSSGRSITNSGAMQPDLVWVKKRNAAFDHNLFDSVRGANKGLESSTTAVEFTSTDRLTAFNADGFTVGAGSAVNNNADTYVAWQWKEGATPGFDIVTYTGDGASSRTIAHALGVTPAMMIVKSRSFADNWIVWHRSLSSATQDYLLLNSTNAKATSSVIWGNTAPTSSVFGVGITGSVGYTNQNAGTYVNYLFSEVAGFSRFGSYTGNGSSDGPFVFCGFRPRFLLYKNSSLGTESWGIIDTARPDYNFNGNWPLFPNSSSAEATAASVRFDLLSNGFKVRGTNGDNNANGNTIIFAAFAENPFKYSLAR